MAQDQNRKSITILYFASLSELLGTDKESCELPPEVSSIEHLKHYLAQRPSPWPAILEQNVLCAVNQEIATDAQAISQHDEVAFFPPVTGG